MTRKRVNLIYKASIGRITGLERDALILQNILRDNYTINHYKITERRLFKKFGIPQNIPSKVRSYLKTRFSKFDVNIFFEKIRPELFHLATVNILFPNQEMFSQNSASLLPGIDWVFCKTQYAYDIFAKLTPKLKLLGFTSQDRMLSSAKPDYTQFFHLAGKSGFRRGTNEILNFWKDNPQLPKLTAVAHGVDVSKYQDCPNIQVFADYIEDWKIKQLQNQIGIHICLSQSEGFGHFIVEAMSSRACIITTNAPPMNELITPDRGCLVDIVRVQSVEKYFDERFFFCPQAFEATVYGLTSASVEEKQHKGERAQEWYEANDRAFRKNLLETLKHVSSKK